MISASSSNWGLASGGGWRGLESVIDKSTGKVNKNTELWNFYNWMLDNAYKYGFILRYPANADVKTGINFEPWHYRYVGVEVATEIHNKGYGYTLEDYVGCKCGLCLKGYSSSTGGTQVTINTSTTGFAKSSDCSVK